MPTNPGAPNGILSPSALLDMSPPLSETLRGGIDSGFDGSEGSVTSQVGPQHAPPAAPVPPPQDFTGMGAWLESDDATVFRMANNLVLRQELPAINHWEIDQHYRAFKLGFPFSILEKDQGKSTYRQSFPAGTKALTIQAVPNMAWDLVNKATEAVLVDPPQYDASPLNDSEQAHAAAEMANRVLSEDSGENGTNDIKVFYDALDGALVCATRYIELYTDPVAGGYVPLQILAHPQAQSSDAPMIGPDGMPTANNILRYVTAPQGGQFTTDPAEAAPSWQPKVRAAVWGREHWRCYPESATVETAEKMIGLLYCTIAEAKRRWPELANLPPDDWNDLLSWTPPRFLNLLPPFQRARWKISNGSDKEKSGSSDERIIFFYKVLQKASPDHMHGAEVYVSGADTGRILHKDVLAAIVTVDDGAGPKREVRCMDLPLIQLTPRQDPDERDPTGRCYMELFCGAVEFNATLATGFLQALNQWLNPDSYIISTSSVQGDQVEESRASGDAIPVLRAEDKPTYGNMPPIPPHFFEAYDRNDQAIRSIGSLPKPITGQDTSQEVSGTARKIAVQQGMVGLSRMQHPVNASFERFGRCKLQLMMRDYKAPQMIRFVGEDGAWQQEEFNATDFALVGSVGIKAGTGTMMPPDSKVQYLGNLVQSQLLDKDEAVEAARQSFAERLGLADNPHEQYVERCVTTWLNGPPPPQPSQVPGQPPVEWKQLWQQYTQQKQAVDQANQAAQAAYAPHAQAAQASGMQPPPPPPQQPEPPAPWHPFQPRPNDSEPALAALWQYRLSKVMSSVKFDAFGPEWAAPLTMRYQAAVTVMQQVAALARAPKESIQVKPGSPQEYREDEKIGTGQQ